MGNQFWKQLKAVKIFDHPRITLVEDTVLLPTGTETQYLRYEGLADYVTIIATKEDKIALLKEYSYPHDEWLWQFPEGSIEQGNTPFDTAKHELAEEASLAADTFEQIGMNYSHHRRSTEKNYIFVATGLSETSVDTGDEEEAGTELHWFSESEIKTMITNGEIKQKNALAALALYFCLQS